MEVLSTLPYLNIFWWPAIAICYRTLLHVEVSRFSLNSLPSTPVRLGHSSQSLRKNQPNGLRSTNISTMVVRNSLRTLLLLLTPCAWVPDWPVLNVNDLPYSPINLNRQRSSSGLTFSPHRLLGGLQILHWTGATLEIQSLLICIYHTHTYLRKLKSHTQKPYLGSNIQAITLGTAGDHISFQPYLIAGLSGGWRGSF
jgi:hypothetical protein